MRPDGGPARLVDGAADDPVARLLRQVETPRLTPAERARLLARLRETHRRDEARRWWLVPAGALAVAAAAFVLVQALSPAPAPAGPAAVAVGDEAVLHPAADARWTVETLPDATEVRLSAGRVSFDVRKHAAQRPFVVRTERARVVVVGTRFSVETDAQATRVKVDEGVVRVEAAGAPVQVRAGESWDSAAVPAAAPAPAEPVPALAAPPEPAARPAVRAGPAPAPALAAEESLLGMARRRLLDQHDPEGALRALDLHAKAHPSATLAREALLLRLSALLETDRAAEAAQAARLFLERHPADPRAAEVRRRLDELCARPEAGCR